jgi:hypothetical protein
MRILYGKCFGLGNAVMAVPAIKALAQMGHEVDVLVGSTRDDPGAINVMTQLKACSGCIKNIYVDIGPEDVEYDVAIMAIPFDGRWKNHVHFWAKRVIDGRPRPGDPNVLGLHSWKRHEVEYQMDNAVLLGYDGPTPSQRFAFFFGDPDPDLVYVGVGFKRDANSFWSKKHWGNDRFIRFIWKVQQLRPGTRFVATGGTVDAQVLSEIGRHTELKTIFAGLNDSFKEVGRACAFFGNDTGMAHVAASFDRPTYVMTAFEGSEVKNPPYCARARCNPFHTEVMDSESVAKDFIDFVWGEP